MRKFLNILDKCLSSAYVTPVVFSLALVFYFTDLTALSVAMCATVVVLILFFCKDIKNIYSIILYVPFFLKDIYSDPKWFVYGLCIGAVCVGFIYFAIKSVFSSDAKLKRGKMFFPLIIADIAFILGGLIGHFKFRVFIIVVGFSIVSYLLYWMAINFTKNLKKHLFFTFVMGALFICINMFISNYEHGGKIFNTTGGWLGTQNINVAALFVLLGVIGCFGFGVGKKYDWAFLLLSAFFCLGVFVLYSRMILLLIALTMGFSTTYMILKSPHKKTFSIIAGVAIILAITLCVVFRQDVLTIIERYTSKNENGSSGRRALWQWCITQFEQNILLGVGFVVENTPVDIYSNPRGIVLAHNTPIQWLASLGLLGSVMISFFYLGKYKVVLDKISVSSMFLIVAVIAIELSGITDQAATMDIFVYILTLVTLCALEKEPKKRKYATLRLDGAKYKIVKQQPASRDSEESADQKQASTPFAEQYDMAKPQAEQPPMEATQADQARSPRSPFSPQATTKSQTDEGQEEQETQVKPKRVTKKPAQATSRKKTKIMEEQDA